jgi:GTP-binding protein
MKNFSNFLFYMQWDATVLPKRTLQEEATDSRPFSRTIVNDLPGPSYSPSEPFQMLGPILTIRIISEGLHIGRILNGSVSSQESLVCINENKRTCKMLRVTKTPGLPGHCLKRDRKRRTGRYCRNIRNREC